MQMGIMQIQFQLEIRDSNLIMHKSWLSIDPRCPEYDIQFDMCKEAIKIESVIINIPQI